MGERALWFFIRKLVSSIFSAHNWSSSADVLNRYVEEGDALLEVSAGIGNGLFFQANPFERAEWEECLHSFFVNGRFISTPLDCIEWAHSLFCKSFYENIESLMRCHPKDELKQNGSKNSLFC
jgi:hypothetical protein